MIKWSAAMPNLKLTMDKNPWIVRVVRRAPQVAGFKTKLRDKVHLCKKGTSCKTLGVQNSWDFKNNYCCVLFCCISANKKQVILFVLFKSTSIIVMPGACIKSWLSYRLLKAPITVLSKFGEIVQFSLSVAALLEHDGFQNSPLVINRFSSTLVKPQIIKTKYAWITRNTEIALIYASLSALNSWNIADSSTM